MEISRRVSPGILNGAAFSLLLPLMLARAVPYPTTIDSLICATSVAEFHPGFLDGKPTYVFLGQVVRRLNDALGGDRADLLALLSRWCALFAWGTLVNVFLIVRRLHTGPPWRAWAGVALLASSPIVVFMSAVVEKYTVHLFLLTLAALLWLGRRYGLFGLAWGLALGAHATAALLAVPCLTSLLRDPARRADSRRALGGALLAGAVAAPLYGWVLAQATGIGAYVAYLRGTVFGEYRFLDALRPSSILAEAIRRPLEAAGLILLLAAAGVAAFLLRRRRGGAGQTTVQGGAAAPAAFPLAAIVGFGIAVVIAYVHRSNLMLILPRMGLPLAALALLRVGDGLRDRPASGGAAAPGFTIEERTFILPWLAVNALFFTIWDRFYGQFGIFIAVPAAIAAAGLGAPAPAPAAGRRWRTAVLVAAIVLGAWLSRDAVERGTWRLVKENEQVALAAAALPPGSLVLAAWDGANVAYHRPDLDVVRTVPGGERRADVWKRPRRRKDPALEVEEAMRAGRGVFVTERWLEQKGDAAVEEVRSRILEAYEPRPAVPRIMRLAPRPR